MNETLAQAILNNQASRAQRLAIADDVIVNNRGMESLKVAVEVLYNQYIKSISALIH